jgi:hypothetical protein
MTAGTQGPTRAHKAQASLAQRPNATTRGVWRGSPPVQRSNGKTVAKKVRWSRGRRLGGLGLMQGKQSSTTPSPAGPAPIPRWRLDHGRLRLGHQRPWLGLLRLRSGHARADDDEDVRLRPPPRMALPQRLQLLPSSSKADGSGKIPQGGGRQGEGRRVASYGRPARVSGHRRTVQMWHGGVWPPSRGASAAGGGGHGAGAVLPSSPCPTACARDKAEEGEKETGKGLTGGVHL